MKTKRAYFIDMRSLTITDDSHGSGGTDLISFLGAEEINESLISIDFKTKKVLVK